MVSFYGIVLEREMLILNLDIIISVLILTKSMKGNEEISILTCIRI